MAVTVEERYGRRLSDSSGEILYLVRGTADAATAKSAVEGEAPSMLSSMPLQDVDVDEIEGLEAFTATARYSRGGASSQPETDDAAFSFDTSGSSQHITHSISTVKRYKPGEAGDMAAIDLEGAIGWDGEHVHGVDIPVAQFAFEVTLYKAKSFVDSSYKNALYQATGKVNSDSFTVAVDGSSLTLAAGECLFLGARGGVRRSQDDYELTYRFLAAPNRNDIVVGGKTGIEKKGFEYLWVQYALKKDEANPLRPTPLGVYIEKVYQEVAFSSLGIPSS